MSAAVSSGRCPFGSSSSTRLPRRRGSRVSFVSIVATRSDRQGVRAGGPQQRHSERGRHTLCAGERSEGPDSPHRGQPRRRRHARAHDDRAFGSREGLPLVGDGVTVEHLLAHRSGIGDYLDEEADVDLEEYPMPVPVHELATTRTTSRFSTGTHRSSRPTSALPTATAATWCSRSSPSARPALLSTSSCSNACASARGCPTPPSCARTSSRLERLVATSRAPTGRTSSICRPRIGRRRHLLARR